MISNNINSKLVERRKLYLVRRIETNGTNASGQHVFKQTI